MSGKKKRCPGPREIMDILTAEAERQRLKNTPQPKVKQKRHVNKRKFDKTSHRYIPMTPSMATRLRYVRHCPPTPCKPKPRVPTKKASATFDYWSSCSSATETVEKSRTSKVRYRDEMPVDITLPTPVPVIMHTTSDQDILNVPSPKLSGAVIAAEKVAMSDAIPLPPKSAYKLYKPHSGIFINKEKDFVPDNVEFPGEKIYARKPRKSKGPITCNHARKGKLCRNKKCKNKACRRQRKDLLRARKRRQRRMHPDEDPCGPEYTGPEHAQIPASLKRGTFETHSLTVMPCRNEKKAIHYGILTGSFNMYDPKFGAKSRGRQALTMSIMAYCLAFHYHPKQWTTKLLDDLLEAGDQWYQQCLDKVHDHSAVQGMCEVIPFGRKQGLNLNRKKMQILLAEPEIVGYTMSKDPMVYNFCRGLKTFFKENRAGILLTRVLKVVIWKDRVCYYVFDPAGRDSRAHSNFTNGRAALINVIDLEAVADVILSRTVVEDQKFVLAPLKVLKILDETAEEDLESDEEPTQAEKVMTGFRILNENCAVVNANMHLGDRCFEEARYRQALPISIVAMTYAKISPPNTWHSKTLDKILRVGNKLYIDCTQPKVVIDITIDNIPNVINLGPYACEIIIFRERVKGQLFTTKECLLNIKTGLEDFFRHEYNNGIIEFNNYTVAVWRQKDMYYLYDPYPRDSDGERTMSGGKACVMMVLNPQIAAEVFTKNWNYLPATTPFTIHGFKVLKMKKKDQKKKLVCTLSDDRLPKKHKVKKQMLETLQAGDGQEMYQDASPDSGVSYVQRGKDEPKLDEENMGEIISLVDSIQEGYVPPIPMRYRNMSPEEDAPRVVNLDSATVSATQVVPPWPRPRDKTDEPPEPDPDPEPTPPPTPPPNPEGFEEDEEEEEVWDEEAESAEVKKPEVELPPPISPPPPSPQPSVDLIYEPRLAAVPPLPQVVEDEILALEPVDVERKILLTEDAQLRYKLRQLRKKAVKPITETDLVLTPSQELQKPHNFNTLPDTTQIISGTAHIPNEQAQDVLPFAAIMAIVTSHKYSINTWTKGIINFVVDTSKKLYHNKLERFQFAAVHIIPRIAIGHQSYQAFVDVVCDGASWQLEDILNRKFFTRYDRGIITTCNYSCAIFYRNGLYYLFDASPCTAMGLRDTHNKGAACFMRFSDLHYLVTRVLFNKDGKKEDQQFVLSHIIMKRLLIEPRMQLPEDYDYDTKKSKAGKASTIVQHVEHAVEDNIKPEVGYQRIAKCKYVIEGTTALPDKKLLPDEIKACHFVCLIAMLLATMRPIKTWSPILIDTCIEKGLEIHNKATNYNICERRTVKNIILDGKFINVNIKKIEVINENDVKTLEQYVKAVMGRLRYVIIRFPECSLVLCESDGCYHLFNPYPSPKESEKSPTSSKTSLPSKSSKGSVSSKKSSKGSVNSKKSPRNSVISKKSRGSKVSLISKSSKSSAAGEDKTLKKKKSKDRRPTFATWSMCRSLEDLIGQIRRIVPKSLENTPEFYTFELTSVKNAPKYSALNCKLSPLFEPEVNPNHPYLQRKRASSLVDEKMYWLLTEVIPWSRMNPDNDVGFRRRTPKAVWYDWDIEIPGDLYSLWGSLHPMDSMFEKDHQGKQYLATCVVALAFTEVVKLSAWTGQLLDGIVEAGNKYHAECATKIGAKPNFEVTPNDLPASFDGMYPYSFSVKFEQIIFGFVYNILPDRFNLSRALAYFFEKKEKLGILVSTSKNLAFGKSSSSYFMFDCQSNGVPVFSPHQGSAYMLKCESLNRLIYCITLTLNIKRHEQPFHLFSATISVKENAK